MIVEIMDRVGGQPIRLVASQVVVRNDDGTPLCVAGEYGPAGAVRASHAGDADFNRTLRAFGYAGREVRVEPINVPGPPRGATLLAGPG